MNKRQNIIPVTLDTTRADHLSCYGYKQPTSPNLDKLAGESVFYTQSVSPSNLELPAHASLLTGKFTAGHGAKYGKQCVSPSGQKSKVKTSTKSCMSFWEANLNGICH